MNPKGKQFFTYCILGVTSSIGILALSTYKLTIPLFPYTAKVAPENLPQVSLALTALLLTLILLGITCLLPLKAIFKRKALTKPEKQNVRYLTILSMTCFAFSIFNLQGKIITEKGLKTWSNGGIAEITEPPQIEKPQNGNTIQLKVYPVKEGEEIFSIDIQNDRLVHIIKEGKLQLLDTILTPPQTLKEQE